MVDPKFTKSVDGFLEIYKESNIPFYLSGSNLSLTLCDRTDIDSNLGNFFISLNLPYKEEALKTESSLAIFYPELLQLNVDKILLINIPPSAYTEFIDARSVELNLPATGTTYNSVKLLSSTYKGNKYGETSPLLGDNIAYLFCDSINLPYTGYTMNDLGIIQSNSANTSWMPSSRNYEHRPSAVSYSEVAPSNDTINSDRRYRINKSYFIDGLFPDYRGQAIGYYDTAFRAAKVGFVVMPDRNFFQVGDVVTVDDFDHKLNPSYSGNVTITSIEKNVNSPGLKYAPKNYNGPFDLIITDLNWVNISQDEAGIMYISGGTYYNYDIPVGFVVLDKGLICITHTDIVNNIDWTLGFLPNGSPSDGTIGSGTTNIYFTNIETTIYGDVEPACSLNLVAIDTTFAWRATCNSTIGDFYISNNPTWSKSLYENQFAANQPLSISEVGLYNEFGELVAVSKFSEPIYKTSTDLFTFEIDINL